MHRLAGLERSASQGADHQVYQTFRGNYSPYAKVLVKTKTTPKNTIFEIFELLYPNHHNIPTIENLVANTQLILEQPGISIY